MSMYSLFKTDESVEQAGVLLDYGSFRVKIARAGGSNRRYAKILETKARPFRRAIETGTMDQERSLGLLHEVYAEAVVLGWETKDEDGEWKSGIEQPDGSLAPYTKANVVAAFEALPDLFSDIQEQASRIALFRQDVLEGISGN